VVVPARRRARLGLAWPRDPQQPARAGFRERFRHDLVDLRECLVLEPALFAVVGALRRLVPDLLPSGGAAEAILTRTDSGIDLVLQAGHEPGLGALEALANLAGECDLARIVWRSREDEALVVERRPVRVVMSGVAVPFPPGAFLQASEAAEAILVEEVAVGVGAHRPALDLFAGLGTFAFALCGEGLVHAVEGDARAASALADAARTVPRVTVERRDLARDPLPPAALADYAAAVFDPPRAGAARQAAALAASSLDAVVAVSCNPATFARDAVRLIAGGFRLERVVPVDQFVWTPHLELVGVFRR
jgi:23S rRNA (uracil1939-C5)-methyltransferase